MNSVGRSGTTSDQPVGFSALPAGVFVKSCRITAKTVVARIPIRIPPRTLRTIRMISSTSPTTNTSVGQPTRTPPTPRFTGTVVWASSGMRRTKPALTKPMMVMKRPMPTTIAIFSPEGTALNTASRNPQSTSTNMTTPDTTIRPMMSGQVRPGVVAIVAEMNPETPSPAERANGYRATRPMRIVMTPATMAVAAATWGMPSVCPEPSGPLRISGFRMTM